MLGGDEGPRPRCARRTPSGWRSALERRGHGVERDGDSLLVPGATPEQVGAIALEERVALVGLAPRARSLEAAFLALTGRRDMSALLRAELLKLRTTRTFAALVGTALALSLLVVALAAALSDDFTEDDVRELFTADFSSLFILLLGVIGMAGEWRHRTITGTVLAAPDRLRLLAAKTLSYAVAGVVLSLIVTVAIMLVGTLILSGRGETTLGAGDLADVLWRNLLVAALLGALRRLRRRAGAQPGRRHRRSAHLLLRAGAGAPRSGARCRALRPDGRRARRHPGRQSRSRRARCSRPVSRCW